MDDATKKNRALEPPWLTVLGDNPLENASDDRFDLYGQVGPVYDLLRHPATQTPLAIALYGEWGAGKTSAMRWLGRRLDEWNEQGPDHWEEKLANTDETRSWRKVRVRPVWFFPWKYQTQDEVWRGLIKEVILHCLDSPELNAQAVKASLKDLGVFLGKGFVEMAAAIKLKTPVIEADGAAVPKVVDHAKAFLHPELAYTNAFEDALGQWVGKTLGTSKRMVIFIDDLDRCLPEVALKVLEALKLYLNIPQIIFVVGVDRGVVDQLVAHHYLGLGLEGEKSKHYLAKMFQVEVTIGPSDPQVENFLNVHLDSLPVWDEVRREEVGDVLDGNEAADVLRAVIHRLAVRSPREVVRLINGALIGGAGARMAEATGASTALAQGMQVFLVWRILEERYKQGTMIGSQTATDFFAEWSKIVRQAGRVERIEVPRDHLDALGNRAPGLITEAKTDAPAGDDPEETVHAPSFNPLQKHRPPSPLGREHVEESWLAFAPSEYHSILQEQRFSHLLSLLADEELGQLMRIPYPPLASAIGRSFAPTGIDQIIREAVARSLDKNPDQVTPADYGNVTKLDLLNADLDTLAPLKRLPALESLRLIGLKVEDLSPLQELRALKELVLDGTWIANLTALRGLAEIRKLWLQHTRVTDLTPLQGLAGLEELNLSGTKVTDLTPLQGLTALERLWLRGTGVTDLTPLRGLTALRVLSLDGTGVTDLTPLQGLLALKWLWLDRTGVTDLTPLQGLTALQGLWLRGTGVTDEEVAKLRQALPQVRISR